MIRNPPLHSWIPTSNGFCSQDVFSLKSGDTRSPYSRYSISSFGWRTPVTPTVVLICWLSCKISTPQPGVLTERFPAFGKGRSKGLEKKLRKWRPQQVYPNTLKKNLAMYLYPTYHLLHQSNQLVYWVHTKLSSWIQQAKIDLQNVRVVFFHGINETYKFRSR